MDCSVHAASIVRMDGWVWGDSDTFMCHLLRLGSDDPHPSQCKWRSCPWLTNRTWDKGQPWLSIGSESRHGIDCVFPSFTFPKVSSTVSTNVRANKLSPIPKAHGWVNSPKSPRNPCTCSILWICCTWKGAVCHSGTHICLSPWKPNPCLPLLSCL